jgi:hypothetical protein
MIKIAFEIVIYTCRRESLRITAEMSCKSAAEIFHAHPLTSIDG